MKIKTLSRPSNQRENSGDLKPLPRSLNPTLTPHAQSIEYARALQTAKLNRVFAKPFIGALGEGHRDAVWCTGQMRDSVGGGGFVSGGAEGEVKVWDLAFRTCVWSSDAATSHTKCVTGLVVGSKGGYGGVGDGGRAFFSCSVDKTVKMWRMGVVQTGGGNLGDESGGEEEEKKEKEEKKKKKKKSLESRKRKLSNSENESDSDSDSDSDSESDSDSDSEDSEVNTTTSRKPTTTSSTKTTTTTSSPKPIKQWLSPHSINSIDHHWADPLFATGTSSSVEIYSPVRTAPITTFQKFWGEESVNVVRFNPAERSLIASCSSDRGIGLYDVRTSGGGGMTSNSSGLKKNIMAMRPNCLEWNPMEPMNFVVGSEDHNCYSFDMRKMEKPIYIHKGHVGAVLSVAFASTGREFVSGSYDRTIRIFGTRDGVSRECYYGKRMQRVHTVNYSSDSKYVISGSDDTNLRVWKSRADEKIGQLTAREERSNKYKDALVKKFKHMPEVRRIVKSRQLPKFVRKQTAVRTEQNNSKKKKLDNRYKHTREGAVQYKSEREKSIIKEIK